MSNLPLELASHLVFIKDQIEWCEGCVIDRDKNNNPICVRDYVNLDNAKEWLNMFIQIEQELGCPLEVMFKALKEGVNIKIDDEEIDIEGWQLSIWLEQCFIINEMLFKTTLSFSEYGKTWWLKGDKGE